MELNLKKWYRDWALMSRFFNAGEIAAIAQKLQNMEIENIVYCSFESRFAKSGGLATVTNNILPYLQEVNDASSALLISPFYPKIMDRSKLKPAGKNFTVPFHNKSIKAGLYEYTWNYKKPKRGSLKEYYLKAEGFFEAKNSMNDPYVYNENDSQVNHDTMNENAMFYCRAVPLAMQALGIRENIIFHLQEWQTALLALTAKEAMLNGTLESCGSVQTMHNSYDSLIPWRLLSRAVDRPRKKLIAQFPADGMTAYQIGLQLVDAPITTVSSNFANEFTSDILHTRHFAPHLQNIFRKTGVYGVNNGMFMEISDEFPEHENHTIEDIHKIKMKNRKALLRILSTYKPKERFGEMTYKGKSILNLPDNVPIIVMSGRLSPLQKGYDIMLRAIENFCIDDIKVVMTPMTTNPADLDYFYEVACKRKGNMTVFPMRMRKGYHELQIGSSFGIMPSIYEPFGAAVEYMANGTVNIGRSTGGLLDQINSKCGLLFKEDAVFYTLENIMDFVETDEVVQVRKTNPWVQSMADNLYDVLKKAIFIYRNNPDKYYKMILNGFRNVKEFNWESNVKKYYQVYEKVRVFKKLDIG